MKWLLSIALSLLVGIANAASTINPNLPANGQPYSASVIRSQFQAAANDVNALQTLNAGSSQPFACSSANLGAVWLNNTSSPYVLNYCDGSGSSGWTAVGVFDATNHIFTPTTGRGACQTLTVGATTDLGSVPQSCITASGNSSVSITSLGSSAKSGDLKVVVFNGTNTLVYNASTLILPNGVNATTSAGDTWLFESLGSGNWTAVSHLSLTPLTATAAPGTGTNIAASLTTAGASVSLTADGFVVCTALSAGICYELGSYTQTFNSATVGAGGMDTGALPTSGYVCIYAIYNPTTVTQSILGVNCATSSTTIYGGSHMPSGYTASALIAAWPTNSSPAMVAGYVNGRTFSYQVNSQIITGSQTSQSSITSLSISGAVPPNAKTITNVVIAIATDGAPSAGAAGMSFFSAATGNTATNSNQGAYWLLTASVTQNWLSTIGSIALTVAQTTYYTATGLGTHVTANVTIAGYTW